MTSSQDSIPTSLVCAGCGSVSPPEELYPFRCRRITPGDDIDHLMTRVLEPRAVRFFGGSESNPFLRYRELLHSYHLARSRGMQDRDYVALVRELDEAIAGVDGHGFAGTPWTEQARLGEQLGCSGGGGVWTKDETGNVSGSHKARHLMGIMIYLRVLERVRMVNADDLPPLAIASCGNAALAAAVVARAAGRRLEVFIPPSAEVPVVERLRELGARLTTCPRADDTPGDPCYRRFRAAVDAGALPFTCQGNENGLTIEGGSTLTYEIISELARGGRPVDRLFVQVGGGALASSCIQAYLEAVSLGFISQMPQLHAVQTTGAAPLQRAFDRLVERVLERFQQAEWRRAGEKHVVPTTVEFEDEEDRAEYIYDRIASPIIQEELRHAATHRSEYMWPWEDEPRSIAHGILDDETYDWLTVVKGMIITGGYPVVVGEERLAEANRLARDTTGIAVCHTGSAGLAGLLELQARSIIDPRESVGMLLTGVER